MQTTLDRKTKRKKADLDAELAGMKRLPRGSFRSKPGATELKNCKVKVSMYLDADVLEYFRARAEQPNAAPYQTQINNELRMVMEGKFTVPEDVKWRLLENEEFLRSLKMKLNAIDQPEHKWSPWKAMPSPEMCRAITAPAGTGVYQIRNKKTGELILFGHGAKCQERMKSLFPAPHGTGNRNNKGKRNYVFEHWRELQFRTIETFTVDEAKQIERALKAKKDHRFNT